MKGNISLKDFIKEVKDDLRSAVDDDDPFFIMEAVELEVSFGLDVEAKAGAKFVVFDLSSKAKAQQSHKVKINLTPFVRGDDEEPTGGGKSKRPVYSEKVAAAKKMPLASPKRKESRSPTMKSSTKKETPKRKVIVKRPAAGKA